MPASWNRKDERQYEHIFESCVTGRKQRSTATCKRIAAATVNKQRRSEGRTLDELVNVESMARKHPDTFLIAPISKRASLEPGDFAKLIFREKGCGERPWVKVTGRTGQSRVRYTGVIDNKTSCGPSFGTEVAFGPQNVADQMGRGTRSVGAWLTALGVLGALAYINRPQP